MASFYQDAGSIVLDAYEALYGAGDAPPIAGDVAFYERLARECGDGVLDLACGTGRVCLPLAEAGLRVTAVDHAPAMLDVARRKRQAASAAARDRLELIEQDMTSLDLGRRFGLLFVAFRSFQHLLTVDAQRQALLAMRRHLGSAGRLVLHLFDPRLELLTGDGGAGPILSGTHPQTRRRYSGDVLRCRFDYIAQVRHDLWRYTEMDERGAVLGEATRELALRWTWRWELRHLLDACGFAVLAEYSDFYGTPPAYGKELIVVARRA